MYNVINIKINPLLKFVKLNRKHLEEKVKEYGSIKIPGFEIKGNHFAPTTAIITEIQNKCIEVSPVIVTKLDIETKHKEFVNMLDRGTKEITDKISEKFYNNFSGFFENNVINLTRLTQYFDIINNYKMTIKDINKTESETTKHIKSLINNIGTSEGQDKTEDVLFKISLFNKSIRFIQQLNTYNISAYMKILAMIGSVLTVLSVSEITTV